jgi:hypothetical protein
MFNVSVTVEVDNGRRALFWQDRWIEGRSLLQLAPNLVVAVPKRAHDHRSVVDALLCDRWISDISDSLSVTTLAQCVSVWEILQGLQLAQDREDKFI